VAALQRPRDLAVAAASAASAKKAADVVVLDLAGLTEAADYFVIASGASDTQVRAIAENVIEEVERGEGGVPWHVEGLAAGRWVLLDYIDVVVHVFHHEMREYYQLERLWGDAARVDWTQ
jgi:ribosome-associated protein